MSLPEPVLSGTAANGLRWSIHLERYSSMQEWINEARRRFIALEYRRRVSEQLHPQGEADHAAA